MSRNNFEINEKRAIMKANLPERTWGEIIDIGLEVAIMFELPKERRYKELYYLSQKKIKKVSTHRN